MPDEVRTVVGDVVLASRSWPCTTPTAPTVVLLHGTGSTAEDWDQVAAMLCHDRQVIAVDLRGHGRSDWPGRYSIASMTADLSGWLDEREDRPVDLVGHSLGGLVACGVAAGAPHQVRRLVLEDVGVPHPRQPATPDHPAGDLPFDWAVVEQVRPEIDDPDPRWADVIFSIPTPTLVIAGGPRSFVPQQHVTELVELLRDGRLLTVDTGHLVHETAPDEFVDALLTFLDGTAESSTLERRRET